MTIDAVAANVVNHHASRQPAQSSQAPEKPDLPDAGYVSGDDGAATSGTPAGSGPSRKKIFDAREFMNGALGAGAAGALTHPPDTGCSGKFFATFRPNFGLDPRPIPSYPTLLSGTLSTRMAAYAAVARFVRIGAGGGIVFLSNGAVDRITDDTLNGSRVGLVGKGIFGAGVDTALLHPLSVYLQNVQSSSTGDGQAVSFKSEAKKASSFSRFVQALRRAYSGAPGAFGNYAIQLGGAFSVGPDIFSFTSGIFGKENIASGVTGGGLAFLEGTVLGYPVEAIKRFQGFYASENPGKAPLNFLQSARSIYGSHGFRGFYVGFGGAAGRCLLVGMGVGAGAQDLYLNGHPSLLSAPENLEPFSLDKVLNAVGDFFNRWV